MDRRPLLALTPALVLAGLLAWIVTVVFALQSSSGAAVVVTRTAVVAVVLVLVTRSVVRRCVDRPGLDRDLALAAVLSGLLFPPAWGGHALAGQLVVDPGWGSAAIDLVLWVVVVVAASRTVAPRPDAVRAPYASY